MGTETCFVGLLGFNSLSKGCRKLRNDTYLPITDPNTAEVRAFIANLLAEEQADITPEEAMDRAINRLRDQHARTIPITTNLVALIIVSLSDLTQDQRQVLHDQDYRR